ncbi:hypothetical protein [Rhizobium sp. TRM95796]|uniref:hypothetical protein n=1 Tax=Rhizobium sp. TRM95796 TaxID=2979862 RepID=UPI0021E71D93|nr:hypothetical protein [Rhizobium sp. TRM95796]MCV3766269.1 hypothetical protein [Rhizobium sp. TRM95796]
MHARSLLDYLSDAERARHVERRDGRDWVSIFERLEDLERRLMDLRSAEARQAAPHEGQDRRALRDEISSILRSRGIAPEPKRTTPPPPLAPRDWVEPPSIAPLASFQPPVEHADNDLLKFIEAVQLLGRAAEKFMAGGGAGSHDDDRLGPARSPEREPRAIVRSTAAAPRSTDMDLDRLWKEVEQLRQTLSQLSPKRDSH